MTKREYWLKVKLIFVRNTRVFCLQRTLNRVFTGHITGFWVGWTQTLMVTKLTIFILPFLVTKFLIWFLPKIVFHKQSTIIDFSKVYPKVSFSWEYWFMFGWLLNAGRLFPSKDDSSRPTDSQWWTPDSERY